MRDCFLAADETNRSIRELDHSPDNRARWRFDFALEQLFEGFEESRLSRYLNEIFEGDPEGGSKAKLLQENVGCAVFGLSTKYQRALMLSGDGANGKSVFLKLVEALFPRDAVRYLSPQHFSNNFKKATLDGALLNVANEIPEQDLLLSGDFKSLIEGNAYTASKKHRPEKTCRAIAAHFFAANTLPRVRDTSHGFWRRWNLVEFQRTFSKEEQDPGLVTTIVRGELPLFLGWAIAGAEQVLKQGGYTDWPGHEAALDRWRRVANNVAMFLVDRCLALEEGDSPTPVEDVFTDYRRYVEHIGGRAVEISRFGQRMKQLNHPSRQRRLEGGRRRYCFDLRLRPPHDYATL